MDETLKKRIELWGKLASKNIDFIDSDCYPFTALNQGATCCSDKHPTWFGTMVQSPQWKAWREHSFARFHEWNEYLQKFVDDGSCEPFDTSDIFFIEECELSGIMSPQHFQRFLNFCKEIYRLR